jgi:uncharacterized protein YndB with AHSA1/START domain
MKSTSATPKQNMNTTLQITRVIKAPRERVYAAWTDPSQLRQWFGPETTQTKELIADPRVGGEFRWSLINCDGEEMTVAGEFRELTPDRKIVFTWQWQDDELWDNQTSVVTVELADREGGTEVCLTHEQLPSEQSRDNHEEGWTSLLVKLENYCAK